MDSGDQPQAELARVRERYLEVVRRALQHTLYRPLDVVDPPEHIVEAFRGALQEAQAAGHAVDLDPVHLREAGRHSDAVYAQTMASRQRLDNVKECIEAVLADGVPGDLIEAGVWRGGIPIYMRAVLEAHGVTDRQVVVADSFQGLPPADVAAYPADAAFHPAEVGRCAADLESVRANFAAYDLLDDQVEFLEGWFRDSLGTLGDRTWSVVRLDGDLYESTWDSLTHLYPNLSPGGFLIVNDWVWPPCRAAVEDFRRVHAIDDEIIDIDWASAYWRRGISRSRSTSRS